MAISVKHKFVSAKVDGTDSTLIQPSNWNDFHDITLAAGKVLGRDSSASGAVQELAISVDSTQQSMIPPSGTTAQRPATPAAGMMRYNSTTGKFEGYTTSWGTLGGGCVISDTAPSNPSSGDLWWKSDEGQMYVYYNDGTSSQWVIANAFAGASVYLPLTGGTVTGPLEISASGINANLYLNSVGGGGRRYLINSSVGGSLVFFDATSAAERMRIDSNGNVGIGMTPTYKFDLTGGFRKYDSSASAYNVLVVENNGGAQVQMGVNSTQGELRTATNSPLVFLTNNAERLRFESGGTVSVAGATMPWTGGGNIVMPDSSALSFSGTTGHFATNLYYSGTWRNGSNAAGGLYVQGSGDHVWYNAPAAAAGTAAGLTERMRMTAAGVLSVGTVANTSPFSRWIPTANVGYWDVNHPTGTAGGNWYYAFSLGGTVIGTITQSGTTGVAYNTSSDYRLKENVAPMTGASERVLALKPSRFNFKAEPERMVDGFIAHEAQEVVPEAITGTKDAVDADGKPVYQGIDQSKLVPLLTAALQEALQTIDDLKARVAALEAK